MKVNIAPSSFFLSNRVYEKTLLVGSQLFSCVVCAKTGSTLTFFQQSKSLVPLFRDRFTVTSRSCLSALSYLAVWFAPKQDRLPGLSQGSSRVYRKTLLVGSQLFSCVVCAKTGSTCYYTTNVHTPLVGSQLFSCVVCAKGGMIIHDFCFI